MFEYEYYIRVCFLLSVCMYVHASLCLKAIVHMIVQYKTESFSLPIKYNISREIQTSSSAFWLYVIKTLFWINRTFNIPMKQKASGRGVPVKTSMEYVYIDMLASHCLECYSLTTRKRERSERGEFWILSYDPDCQILGMTQHGYCTYQK